MSDRPEYSIAVCNYNMADTLEISLRSMADQVDPEQFEVVVVDGGSTDSSQDILRRLEDQYEHVRAVLDRQDEMDWLGGDRNISFEESRGEYVLESLDTDDRYHDGIIKDFVTIYHALEPHVDGEFFLSGTGINMAPRSLLLEVPYYDLGGAEDRDFWRRLYARDALIWLDHGPVSDQIGYHKSLRDRIGRDIHGKICDFQSGISFWSTIAYTLHHKHHYILEERRSTPVEFVKRMYDLVTYPYAYLKSLSRHHHDAPPEFRRRGALERRIAETKITLPELEAEYDFRVDRDALSPAGREAYLSD
ncbi:glycosyltransferase [Halobellus ordinarius]|uniref:glycosyltransferase n=1 Tax=Halobellus ordinarius TaxID=3075120 RepID=UPI0028803C43|nr:glycosyltransferase family A protein [Halobellus sp. ZY16]